MNILYLTSVNFDEKKYKGVVNKIGYQIEGFKKNGATVTHYNFDPVKNTFLRKVLRRVSIFASNSYIKSNIDLDMKKYDVVYVRYTLSDYHLIKLFKNIKATNPKIKLVLEIPTYPYEAEYKDNKKFMFVLRDKLFRKQLNKYVDKISTFSNHDEIFGCKTINISNGIDLDVIKLRNKIEIEESVNILAVANISFWHGYDRAIKGIYDYKKEFPKGRKVKFYLVGLGEEEAKLKKIVEELNLSAEVEFLGYKTGKELDDVFAKAHIGIDHLGLHRKDMKELSSLKSKEYCARGIPFILSHHDKDFVDFKYVMDVVPTEENLNIKSVVDFTESIYAEESFDISMRDYAGNFAWEKITKDIIRGIMSVED